MDFKLQKLVAAAQVYICNSYQAGYECSIFKGVQGQVG